MKKLHLPKNHITGIKVFCKKCRQNNTNCNHYHDQVYRIMIHVPGTKGNIMMTLSKNPSCLKNLLSQINSTPLKKQPMEMIIH